MGKTHACASCRDVLTVFILMAVAPARALRLQLNPLNPRPRRSMCAVKTNRRRRDLLRGAYGSYGANNDLLFYHLDIRIDPARKFVSGKNTIRFKMLQDDTRIQLDLADALNINKILLDSTPLHYERDSGAVFVDFLHLYAAVPSTRSTFTTLGRRSPATLQNERSYARARVQGGPRAGAINPSKEATLPGRGDFECNLTSTDR